VIAETIIALLRYRHAGEIFVTELRGGAGGRATDNSYIDAYALHPYPSKQNCRVAYEVKVSRSDFLKDIKQPHKHRAALVHSNEFYFVAPEGLLKAEEMPLFAGLREVFTDNHGSPYLASPTLQAPWRDTNPPSWRFVASLCRNIERDGKLARLDAMAAR
jgi:hypothetical protein